MKHKIEFWISQAEKKRLVKLCKVLGYTVAEIMRRATEVQIAELEMRAHNAR